MCLASRHARQSCAAISTLAERQPDAHDQRDHCSARCNQQPETLSAGTLAQCCFDCVTKRRTPQRRMRPPYPRALRIPGRISLLGPCHPRAGHPIRSLHVNCGPSGGQFARTRLTSKFQMPSIPCDEAAAAAAPSLRELCASVQHPSRRFTRSTRVGALVGPIEPPRSWLGPCDGRGNPHLTRPALPKVAG